MGRGPGPRYGPPLGFGLKMPGSHGYTSWRPGAEHTPYSSHPVSVGPVCVHGAAERCKLAFTPGKSENPPLSTEMGLYNISMRENRRYKVLLIVATLAWFAPPAVLEAAPLPSEANRAPIVVGFSQDTLANDWRMAQVRALQAGFSRYPHIHFIYTDGKGSTPKQIQDVEDLVFSGIDILITSPRDSRAMLPVISSTYEKGIPVILLTRRIDGDAYTTYISPDDAAIARDAARYIGDKLNGRGSVLMLQGLPSTSTAITRTKAFTAELGNFPGITLAATKTANYLRSDAIKAVEETLQQGIPFDAIYAQSDSMASGARIALKKAGRDLSKVLIVGIDYISEAREAIRSGHQSASFTYPTCAEEAVEAVLAIAEGRTPAKTIHVPSQRVTRDNVEQVVPIFQDAR